MSDPAAPTTQDADVDYLEQYRVPCVPEVYYIPDFITEHEEEYLLRKAPPQPMWRTLANRRLQIWGGIIKNGVLVGQKLPDWLDKFPDLVTRLRDTGAFKSAKHGQPNHVIVNEYLAGQGIMPHEDGPAYHPVVGTISLGSHAVFNYYKYADTPSTDAPADAGRAVDRTPLVSLLLEPRSLVITRSSLYTGHLHGIEERTHDVLGEDGVIVANAHLVRAEEARTGGTLTRATRMSLTCRDVERVLDVKRFGK
ncbi:hypothetical protein EXIGLDRAFT_623991 [Exidia glandulosa HHB12029]|uniref:Fe2OG dioxygenase domain-containing protein n=1 Tax=Exidia glandulosa HHB12029 TaxID=1314781 RepID=A0A165DIL6_EXIGL|nr:hypothetical protein EXIGLDRAFT_623991 [Exidia glandulosa HHB12029]